jgi:hypothetical protein
MKPGGRLAIKKSQGPGPAGSGGRLEEDMETGLAELPAERQAALRDAALQFSALTPEEQVVVRAAAEREMLDHQAEQVIDAALDALRRGRVLAILPRLSEAADSFLAGQAPGSPSAGLARFIEAVASLLRDNPLPPASLAPEYAVRLVTFDAELKAIRSRQSPGVANATGPDG